MPFRAEEWMLKQVQHDGLREGDYAPANFGGIYMSMTGWIIIGVIVLLLLFAVAIYNRLVRLRSDANAAFATLGFHW